MESLKFKLRAECQEDFLEFWNTAIVWCSKQNERLPKTELIEGKDGFRINADLVDSNFDLDVLKEKITRKAAENPPRMFFCVVNLESSEYDTEVEFETSIPYNQIRALVRSVPDGHVMLETLRPLDEYTGERTYGE